MINWPVSFFILCHNWYVITIYYHASDSSAAHVTHSLLAMPGLVYIIVCVFIGLCGAEEENNTALPCFAG